MRGSLLFILYYTLYIRRKEYKFATDYVLDMIVFPVPEDNQDGSLGGHRSLSPFLIVFAFSASPDRDFKRSHLICCGQGGTGPAAVLAMLREYLWG